MTGASGNHSQPFSYISTSNSQSSPMSGTIISLLLEMGTWCWAVVTHPISQAVALASVLLTSLSTGQTCASTTLDVGTLCWEKENIQFRTYPKRTRMWKEAAWLKKLRKAVVVGNQGNPGDIHREVSGGPLGDAARGRGHAQALDSKEKDVRTVV